jgi:hypothetical protein
VRVERAYVVDVFLGNDIHGRSHNAEARLREGFVRASGGRSVRN